MDAQIKAGQVYLQPRKAGKKWKQVWLSLFPPSNNGVGRLEIQDMGGGAVGVDLGTVGRRHHQHYGDRKLKVVRLSELISVLRLPPNAEACPLENMSAFCVETEERTMVFAALKDDCVEWVEKLCRTSFQGGGVGGSGSNHLHMEENQIYASADEVSAFLVVVQKTDAAARCDLEGKYWIQIGKESLVLKETQTKNIVREWPYHLLRRYGNDNLTLTIEAGRRCDTGPGTFIFKTEQADNMFSLIQKSIKKKTSSNQSQEGEKVASTKTFPRSPLPKIPDMTNISAILENKMRMEVEKTAGSDETKHSQKVSFDPSPNAPMKPPPITLLPLPDVPTSVHTSPSTSHPIRRSEALYADPDTIIHSAPQPKTTTAVYVDPAVLLPLKPHCASREFVCHPPSLHSSTPHSSSNIDSPDSIYSEVFDKVTPVENMQNMSQNRIKEKCFADDESHYVYAEPMSEMEGASHKKEIKADPFEHLYAKVCKTKPAPNPSLSSTIVPSPSASSSSTIPSTLDTNKVLSDVIYDNLGII
ncbi:uncharacterized protein dok1a [Genypterus blacodes]|uniref:uncharacterized protein dok1a n=1 Tax=Genypterus blacodes TaxID=154954 RepID=UPI003F75F188